MRAGLALALLHACWMLGDRPAAAVVQLPRWFGDGMVLQTSDEDGPPAFLAGRTVPPGEKVSITGDVGEYTVTSEPVSGHWKVTLTHSSHWKQPQAGGSGMTIHVQGATGAGAVVTGVQAGDVFFCAGQSNMLFSLHQSINYTAEAATLASYPNFRFFMTNRALNDTAQFDVTTDDKNCDAAAPPAPPVPPGPPPAGMCEASSFLNNTFYGHGHGPSIGHAAGKDAAECCAQCSGAEWAGKGCRFWSFAPAAAGDEAGSAGTCWFKTSGHGPARALPGAVSGSVGGPPPPPPPPKPCNRWLTPAEASANSAGYLLSFSAVCFMTVRDIARMHTHDRPMGLVQVAWGGSRIESWMSPRALASAGPPLTGQVAPVNTPIPKPNTANANVQSSLYNGMVAPWTNFSVRAALWCTSDTDAIHQPRLLVARSTTPDRYYC